MLSQSLLWRILCGCDRGLKDWLEFRSYRQELQRFFRHDGRHLETNKTWSSLVQQLMIAVRSRVEGVVYFERHLPGLMHNEAQDDFWSLKGLERFVPGGHSEAELQYMVRYSEMSRIDVYYIINGQEILQGGLRLGMYEPALDAVRGVLKIPRTVTVSSDSEPIRCILSLGSNRAFLMCPLLYVKFDYET